jgi:hypothetical protein
MDILRNRKTVEKWSSHASAIRFTPKNIDPEGLKILREAGFVWDSRSLAFRRSATGHPERRSTIEYGFLCDQRLVVNTTLDEAERAGQLQRLRILVQSMD